MITEQLKEVYDFLVTNGIKGRDRTSIHLTQFGEVIFIEQWDGNVNNIIDCEFVRVERDDLKEIIYSIIQGVTEEEFAYMMESAHINHIERQVRQESWELGIDW